MCMPSVHAATLFLQVSDLQAILRDTNHNGFPVVRDSSVGQICLGLISRAHLLALLQRLIDSYQAGSSRGASPGISIPMADGVSTTRQQLQQPLMAREVSRGGGGRFPVRSPDHGWQNARLDCIQSCLYTEVAATAWHSYNTRHAHNPPCNAPTHSSMSSLCPAFCLPPPSPPPPCSCPGLS